VLERLDRLAVTAIGDLLESLQEDIIGDFGRAAGQLPQAIGHGFARDDAAHQTLELVGRPAAFAFLRSAAAAGIYAGLELALADRLSDRLLIVC